MKKLVIVLSAIGLLSLNSCKQETDPQALMENPEIRTEVFNAITANQDYMTEFMANMHKSDAGMQMMQGDGMQMMMKNMMQGMMKDGKMMGTMMKMMHEKGMMSEECMESCKEMMGEKGMDMKGMGMMNNMDSSSKEDHTEHH